MKPRDTGPIGFAPVTSADLPLLRTWMDAPHWRRWWGDPDAELALIADMVEGRDTTRPYLFSLDGKPVGYIQVWQIRDHQTPRWIAEEPWLADVPADAVGVDLSIGDAANLSKGLGSRALQAFVAMLLEEGHRTILIDPDPANARAVAAYRKAGFVPVPHLDGHTDGVLIMQYAAQSADAGQYAGKASHAH